MKLFIHRYIDGSTLNQLRRLGILVEGDNHQMSLV